MLTVMKAVHLLLILVSTAPLRAQQETDLVADAAKLTEWLPTEIGGYRLSGAPYSSVLKDGDKPYAVASKRYVNAGSDLMIFVADYKGLEVPRQQVKAWSAGQPFDDDRRVGGSLEVAGFPAWQSYSKEKNSAILYVAVKERYLITLTLSGGTSGFLKKAAEGLSLKSLP
jgi:hypothetical protein